MLTEVNVCRLVDVRSVPRSRMNPQFNRETLPETLQKSGIAYEHELRLGGLRHARRDSPNTGWRNGSFRGYADHMATPEFGTAVDELIERARAVRTAVMCAEAVPWRCHRSLIADALTVRGAEVLHILGAGKARPHEFTSFARIQAGKITYPRDSLLTM